VGRQAAGLVDLAAISLRAHAVELLIAGARGEQQLLALRTEVGDLPISLGLRAELLRLELLLEALGLGAQGAPQLDELLGGDLTGVSLLRERAERGAVRVLLFGERERAGGRLAPRDGV